MKNSVVITTYNGEKYIIKQLESIRNQTLPPDEVIIRDDGSTDNSSNLIKDYIRAYGLNHWDFKINKTNKGFYNNFLDAIRACAGDVIFLSDQDDVWAINKIERFHEIYQTRNDVMMVQSNVRFIDEAGKTIASKEPYHGKKSSDSPIRLTIKDMFKFAGSGYTMSFRRAVSDKIFQTGFDKEKNLFGYHDLLLGQVSAVMGKCYLLSDIIDSHRLHATNQTQRSGKSYLVGRTRQAQLDILVRRCGQCEKMMRIADVKQQEFLSSFIAFTRQRIELIENKRIRAVPYLIQHRDYYASGKGLITDLLYAFGLERLLLWIYKKL